MTDEQFPWLDWPHSYAPPNLNQNAARAEENSNHQWRSPFFYNSSTSTLQTHVNNNNNNNNNNSSSSGQSQYYPSYQQQEESYVRLEDVLSYPSYRWGPPPAREYQRQTTYPETTTVQPAASLPQQSPKRTATAGRQLPNPRPQTTSGESHITNDLYSNHEAKRRRLEAPASQAPSQTLPATASQPYLQQGMQDNTAPSQYAYTSSNTPSRAPMPPASQPTTQPMVQHTAPQFTRPGSQYIPPSRQTPQAPQHTASPVLSQTPSQCMSQPDIHAQSNASSNGSSRAAPSASPQTTAQHIPRRNPQFASPQSAPQSLPQTVASTTKQSPAQQTAQQLQRPSSQFASPQNKHLTLPQSAPQSAAHTKIQQQNPQRPSPQSSQPNSRPVTQPLSATPSSQPLVSKAAVQSATPPVTHRLPQTIPPQMPPSTQTAPPAASSQPSQNMPQMAQGPHALAARGPFGNFAAYSYQPANPADKTSLKRRLDIVSRLREEDAAQKVTYDPQTIARDILIASSRHPTEAPLNHHLFRLRDVFSAVDMNSDLETFRWDLVDPGERSRDLKQKRTFAQTSQTAPPPAVQVVQPPTVNNNNLSRQPAAQTQHRAPQPTSQQVRHQPQPQVQLSQALQPRPQPQPQVQVPPSSQPQPKPQAVSTPAPAPASTPAQGPLSQASTPSTPNSTMEKRRRGRPPGSTNKPKTAAAVAPPPAAVSHPVFACNWENCKAELHNLDTLKKHIFKLHVQYSVTCAWKDCTLRETVPAMPAMQLMQHIKQEHVDSLAWKLGDGPALPTSEDQNGGNTVLSTMPESGQPGNEATLIFPANYMSIRAYNRVHGNNSQAEKAREILRAVQRLKEHVGVGLDPGGCELATPERNQRVSNDEDVYEVRSVT
ncbi:hypothetical protein BJX61DRAFT_541820 [Aspergillus egyptiacus]|nr:hypothetical protein BJX61DRAFT_541820 [Aspergillus egyptiacus]